MSKKILDAENISGRDQAVPKLVARVPVKIKEIV